MVPGGQHHHNGQMMADGVVLGIPHNVLSEPQEMGLISPVLLNSQAMNMLAAGGQHQAASGNNSNQKGNQAAAGQVAGINAVAAANQAS